MKIVIQSILFIAIVGMFVVTSDKLSKLENVSSMSKTGTEESTMGDEEFLDNAIPHHEGAVVMAQSALTNSDRPEIREFANAVITGESASIDQLYKWRRDWYGKSDRIFLDQVKPEVSMVKDLGGKDTEFDLRFLNAMIDHHEGAIKMLNGILIPTTRPEIHSTAVNGVIALSKDVQMMEAWRKEWYGK